MILGPGEAKGQLKSRLASVKVHVGMLVDVEAADTMTNDQVVARVNAHFANAL